MPSSKNITFKLFLFLISTDFLETFTHYCFKRSAMPQSGFQVLNIGDAFMFAKISALSPFLWLGLLSVLLTFIIWSTILTKIDLSVAVPIASFSYVFIPLVSMVFLHETIGPLRWAGIAFILTGVILVSLSSKEKEKEAQTP